MTFEIGKFYRRSSGEYWAVRGTLPFTTEFGPNTMIAEVWPNYLESFNAVSQDESATEGWEEVTEAEWNLAHQPQQEAMVSDEAQDNHPR